MTIKEIAQLAGVSVSTVSKIVNNKDSGINPQTRSRVLKIVKEYNYTPYGAVKNNSSAKKFLIGILLRNASQASALVGGILEEAQAHGYTILLLDSQNSVETEMKQITVLCSNSVDGVIWEPVSPQSHELQAILNRHSIPFCCVNAPVPFSSYSIDYAQMGYVLTQKLIDYRHANLGCLLKKNSRRALALYEGFQKCLYDNQIPLTDRMTFFVSDENYCQAIMDYRITGIVSSHFSSALHLYEQMNKRHYYIPSDLSLVCLKKHTQEFVSYPHISGIRIPALEFGRYVASELIRICERSAETEPREPLFSPPGCLDSEDSLSLPSPLRTKRFVVVGAINLDVTFNVDELPQHGKTVNILNSVTTAGGKGANQAVGVARLGHEVALIGEVGADTDSTYLFDVLEKERVITQGVHMDSRRQTGKAYIYTSSDGESAISILSGANESLRPEDIVRQQYLFNNSGYCLISTEIPTETVVSAARTAKGLGLKTIVKPAVLNSLPQGLAENTDIFVPNQKEASLLCPGCKSVPEQAEYFLTAGVRTVIITLGHRGCYVKSQEIDQYFPAAPDFTPVDTTGGADAFIAALASYLNDGYPLDTAVRIASYAAGFCISRQGVANALVDKATLEMHISKKEMSLLV